MEPLLTIKAVVMAVLLSGTIATPEPELTITDSFGTRKSTLLDSFKVATESALARSKFIHITELETLQALVIYLIAICRVQLSKNHIALLGVAIGVAETMDLQRSRIIYFRCVTITCEEIVMASVCFLDFRACEVNSPSS